MAEHTEFNTTDDIINDLLGITPDIDDAVNLSKVRTTSELQSTLKEVRRRVKEEKHILTTYYKKELKDTKISRKELLKLRQRDAEQKKQFSALKKKWEKRFQALYEKQREQRSSLENYDEETLKKEQQEEFNDLVDKLFKVLDKKLQKQINALKGQHLKEEFRVWKEKLKKQFNVPGNALSKPLDKNQQEQLDALKEEESEEQHTALHKALDNEQFTDLDDEQSTILEYEEDEGQFTNLEGEQYIAELFTALDRELFIPLKKEQPKALAYERLKKQFKVLEKQLVTIAKEKYAQTVPAKKWDTAERFKWYIGWLFSSTVRERFKQEKETKKHWITDRKQELLEDYIEKEKGNAKEWEQKVETLRATQATAAGIAKEKGTWYNRWFIKTGKTAKKIQKSAASLLQDANTFKTYQTQWISYLENEVVTNRREQRPNVNAKALQPTKTERKIILTEVEKRIGELQYRVSQECERQKRENIFMEEESFSADLEDMEEIDEILEAQQEQKQIRADLKKTADQKYDKTFGKIGRIEWFRAKYTSSTVKERVDKKKEHKENVTNHTVNRWLNNRIDALENNTKNLENLSNMLQETQRLLATINTDDVPQRVTDALTSIEATITQLISNEEICRENLESIIHGRRATLYTLSQQSTHSFNSRKTQSSRPKTLLHPSKRQYGANNSSVYSLSV